MTLSTNPKERARKQQEKKGGGDETLLLARKGVILPGKKVTSGPGASRNSIRFLKRAAQKREGGRKEKGGVTNWSSALKGQTKFLTV